MKHEMEDLFAYDRWANRRVLDACAALPDEAVRRDMDSSFPSVLATLEHVLSSEWIWLERWNGRSPLAAPDAWDLSTLVRIREEWARVENAQAAFLRSLTDDGLSDPVEYRNTRGQQFTAPLGQLMRHMVNHSTYHRGQIATMLRQLGHAPPATDLVLYHRTAAEELVWPPAGEQRGR